MRSEKSKESTEETKVSEERTTTSPAPTKSEKKNKSPWQNSIVKGLVKGLAIATLATAFLALGTVVIAFISQIVTVGLATAVSVAVAEGYIGLILLGPLLLGFGIVGAIAVSSELDGTTKVSTKPESRSKAVDVNVVNFPRDLVRATPEPATA